MTKMLDVCSPRPRKNSDKPYWHRVGTAFEGEKGMNLVFDSLPLPDKDGRVSVFLFEQRDKTQPTPSVGINGKPIKDDMDEEIPF